MLETFLNNKPLYYDEIDYTRMPRVYAKIQKQIKLPKIIHVIGTNGKGTTGRFLATALYALGFHTGHYTSPHIVDFNERIWLDGANISNEILHINHQKLLKLLSKEDAEALSYFEYTSLLAMLIYKECDFLVLEAGLGGEHDATAVFPNILTLVTPIDKDHEAFLGDTISAIAQTKLNAIKKHAILAKQAHKSVYEVAQNLAHSKDILVDKLENLLNASDLQNIKTIAKSLDLALYLQENLSLAIAALNFLQISYTPECFSKARLFGRLTQLEENIIVDVGHNTLAAQKIAEALAGKKYTLVYNSYKDKNYAKILQTLKPIILEVDIISVEEKRIEEKVKLEQVLNDLQIQYRDFTKVQKDKTYLVFGSFSVVETFLKRYHG